ncbi:hypothetical protein KBC99_00060 [Candidatus Saccharibacteria bacterium]|nr:hypothetical protein [Candidatus Saccharibacteria bacterium]
MTPTELYNHISETEGIPMQELNPLQYELMQIAEEAEGLRGERQVSRNQVSKSIDEISNKLAGEYRHLERAQVLREKAFDLIDITYNETETILGRDRDYFFTGIAQLLVRLGEVERAKQIVDSFDVISYKASALSKIGALTHDIGLVEEALRLANEISGDGSERTRVLGDVTVNIARGGFFDLAIESVMPLTDWSERSLALSDIAIEIAHTGDLDRAIQLANEASIPTDKDRIKSEIAICMAGSGNIEEALAIISQDNKVDANRAKVEIIKIIAQAGDYQRAFQLAGVFFNSRDEYSHDLALSHIAVAQANRGDTDEALRWLGMMHDSNIKAMALAQIGTNAQLSEIIGRALDAVQGDGIFDIAASTLNPVFISKALQRAESQTNSVYKERQFALMAPLLVKTGDTDKALMLIHSINDDGTRINALISVVQTIIGQLDALEKDKPQPASIETTS